LTFLQGEPQFKTSLIRSIVHVRLLTTALASGSGRCQFKRRLCLIRCQRSEVCLPRYSQS